MLLNSKPLTALELAKARTRVDSDYYSVFGNYVDWHKPKTYTEKIQVYKLSDECEALSQYADKFEVRNYVESKIGKGYLIRLLGLFASTSELIKALPKLPISFVIKTTRGSGWNLIVQDKSKHEWKKELNKIDTWLKTNYFDDFGKERQYRRIQPKIIVEDYISDKDGKTNDYKFFCFDGHVEFVQIDYDRYTSHTRNFYTKEEKQIGMEWAYSTNTKRNSLPKNFKKMIAIAEQLSANFSHVRVDLYSTDNDIYFGELTFTPENGISIIKPHEYNIMLANKWNLPLLKSGPKIGVVYTCITAHYDELYNHTYMNPDWDYVCFTDELSIGNENNSSWKLRPLAYTKLDPVRNQRWHKLHAHTLFPEYEYSLWIDSNIDVLTPAVFEDVYAAIKNKQKIAIAPHPARDCIYDEIDACLLLKKDDPKLMNSQIEAMKKDGFPAHFGLFETNIMLRKHSDKVIQKAMKDWWSWIEKYSKRDQLSLTYVLWKNKLKVKPLTKIHYRTEDGRVRFWHHRTELRNNPANMVSSNELLHKQLELKDKIIATQTEIHQLEKDLSKIKSAKFYKLWQMGSRFSKLISK